MAEKGEHLVLGSLKRIEARLGRIEGDVSDIKGRLASLGANVAQRSAQFAVLHAWMGRFDERLKRIERRLDLARA